MKAILKAYSISLLITGITLSGKAFAEGDPTAKKEKTYSKSYTVGSSDKISFNNQFGDMKISTWDKNEVKVDITMSAEAATDEKAQHILDLIRIEDGKDGGNVWFKTKIGDKDKEKDKKDDHWEKGEKQSFKIDYVVMVPAHNPLNAENQFGQMTIGDFNGDATLTSKFGGLTAGKLQNVKVDVEFGKANIASINGGKLTIKFSRGLVENMDGSVNANFEFCDGVKLKVDNSLKDLTIKNSYTHLYLDVSINLSANFDINTSFGEVNNKTSFPIKEEGRDDDDRRGPHFNKKYSGKSGSGNIPMKIKSDYGEVTIGHNINFDVSKDEDEDHKGKGKKRVSI